MPADKLDVDKERDKASVVVGLRLVRGCGLSTAANGFPNHVKSTSRTVQTTRTVANVSEPQSC